MIQFIKFNRKLGNAVTFFRLTLQLIKIDPKRKEYSFKTNRNWVYLFLIKNNYVQRKPSHLGQKLPNNIIDEISHFLSEFYDYRAFNKIDNCVICNNDETPIFLNMPSSKTIEKKGKKNIIIYTQNQEKCRIAILLGIIAGGNKLPPLIIFKAKENRKVYADL